MPAADSQPRPRSRRSIAGRSPAALAVAAGIFLSRIAGLVRERVFAHYLGNSDAAGAFKAALRIPNVLQNLFGEGVLSASFIPVYARLLAEGRREEAGRVAATIASLLALVVAVLAVCGVLLARPLIDLVAPGFHGEVRELTIQLVQVMFPGVGLVVLSAWCLGVLNSHKRFFLAYVAPVLWNVAMIAALVGFGHRLLGGLGQRAGQNPGQTRLAVAVAWGSVVGAGLQLGVQLPSALRLARGDGPLRPSLSLASSSVRRVLSNFGPVVLSRGVVQVSAYVDQLLASYLGAGIVAAMAYAQVLYLLPISLFGMAVTAAELPEMSRAVGTEDETAAKLRARLAVSLRRISFYVVPSSAAFLALGDTVAATVFQTGRFGANDAQVVWLILAGSTVGLLAATHARLLSSAFWALGDTRTPLRFAVVRVALTALGGLAAAFPLRHHFGLDATWGAVGLTASAGLSGWVEYALLRRALVARIGAFSVGGAAVARCWLAALPSAALAFALARALPAGHPVLVGVAVLGLYGVGYLGLARLLRVAEVNEILGRLRSLAGR